jgi:hypothetical protein
MRVNRRNRRLTAASVRALRLTGKLEECDQALVGLCQTSADALDEARAFEEKSYAIAKVGQWHLNNVLALLGRLPEDKKGDDDLGLVLAGMSNRVIGDAFEQGRNSALYGDGDGPDRPWDR